MFETDSTDSTLIRKSYFDNTPTLANRKLDITAIKGDKLTFKLNLSQLPPGPPYYTARWYVNGCLNSTQPITGMSVTSPEIEIPATTVDLGKIHSGLNDECSGKHFRGDTDVDGLGKLVVSVSIVSGSEKIDRNTGAFTSGTAFSYLFNVGILNTNPLLVTETSSTRWSPYLVNSLKSVPFMVPVAENNKNLLVHTFSTTTTATQVYIGQLSNRGDYSQQYTITCNAGGEPQWLGINPVTGSSLQIAMLNSNDYWSSQRAMSSTYPKKTTELTMYNSSTNACYYGGVNLAATSAGYSGTASMPAALTEASVLAFGKYRTGSRSVGSYITSSSSLTGALIDSENPVDNSPAVAVGSFGFWKDTGLLADPNASPSPATPMTYNSDIFQSNQPAAFTGFIKNRVIKNITSGNNLIQLVGPMPGITENIKGFVLVSTLSARITNSNFVTASGTKTVDIAATCGSGVGPAADAPFPTDGIYSSANDTLYSIVAPGKGAANNAYLVKISALSTNNPTCSVISTNRPLKKPSADPYINNVNLNKMVLDSDNTKLLWALITQDSSGQMIVYDTVTGKRANVTSLSFFRPHSVVMSPGARSVHVFKHQKDATSPTLYRVW
jgi:hypothetical protein